MFWLYVVLAVFWAVILIDYMIGFRSITKLEKVESERIGERISVILAAKDEEKDIAATIQSLLAQRHVDCEIIAVNDRSNDKTGDIIQKLADEHTNVTGVDISTLPEGWLGKNHALHQGFQHATGRYILFTDADIQFTQDAIAKACTVMERESVDHITAAPELHAKTFWLSGLISFFLLGFGYLKRPWAANKDQAKSGMGIGAFNLLSRDCYEKIGGHEAIRLRPDDDLELGNRVKRLGFKQRLVTALYDLSVEWYPSLPSALRGFEKNAFAGLNYSVLLAFTAVLGVFLSQVVPFLLIFISPLEIQIISALNIVLLFCLYALTIHNLTRFSLWYIFGLPLFAMLFIYMLIRALVLTWVRGGIEWRGSRYSLKELKRHSKNSEED